MDIKEAKIICEMNGEIISRCEFCNPDMSYGNKEIYKEDDIELFIANDLLRLLKEDSNMARNILIRYCPMCGRKLR